jgi:hypothetical protein
MNCKIRSLACLIVDNKRCLCGRSGILKTNVGESLSAQMVACDQFRLVSVSRCLLECALTITNGTVAQHPKQMYFHPDRLVQISGRKRNKACSWAFDNSSRRLPGLRPIVRI